MRIVSSMSSPRVALEKPPRATSRSRQNTPNAPLTINPVHLGPRDPRSKKSTQELEHLVRPDARPPRDAWGHQSSADDPRSVSHTDSAADGHAAIGVDLERPDRAGDRVRLQQAVGVDDDHELAAGDRDPGVERIRAPAVVLVDDPKPRLGSRDVYASGS
jgi:hypothetical protein